MRRVLWSVVVLVILSTLVGCGGGGGTHTDPVVPPDQSTDWRIGLSELQANLYPGSSGITQRISTHDGNPLPKELDDVVFEAPEEVIISSGTLVNGYREFGIRLASTAPAETTYTVKAYHPSHPELKSGFNIYTGPKNPELDLSAITVTYDAVARVWRVSSDKINSSDPYVKWETPEWLLIKQDGYTHTYTISRSGTPVPGIYQVYAYLEYEGAPDQKVRSAPVTVTVR